MPIGPSLVPMGRSTIQAASRSVPPTSKNPHRMVDVPIVPKVGPMAIVPTPFPLSIHSENIKSLKY